MKFHSHEILTSFQYVKDLPGNCIGSPFVCICILNYISLVLLFLDVGKLHVVRFSLKIDSGTPQPKYFYFLKYKMKYTKRF